MNSASLQAVAFDLDGLIANSEDLYELAGDEVLARRGKTHDATLREQMMGRPVVDSLRIMIEYHALPDPLNTLMDECRQVLERLMDTSLAPMPGFHDLVDELLAADIPIAVATSGTRVYADDVLTRLAIKERFRFVLTSEDIKHGKPAPDVYLLAAQRFQIEPARMLVLEDSANGCRAGVAAGAFTVAVPNRHTQDHDFVGAAFIADTLADPRIRQVVRGCRDDLPS